MVAIQGIIVPADWDENGNVTAVAVSTYDDEEYLIDKQEGQRFQQRFEEMMSGLPTTLLICSSGEADLLA